MDGVVVNAGAQGGISAKQLAQEPGDSATLVMSQKAVTEYVNSKAIGGGLTFDVPQQDGSQVYTGEEITAKFAGYYEEYMQLSGVTSATDAGTYTATFVPKPGSSWSDGSKSIAEVEWTIQKAPGLCDLDATAVSVIRNSSKTVTVTRLADAEITVTSSDEAIVEGAISGSTVTVIGKSKGHAALTITAAATKNYEAASVQLPVSVYEVVRVPEQSGTLTYNGDVQSPTWDGYSSSSTTLTMSGINTGTNAGPYNVEFGLKDGYCWPDGDILPKTVQWTINKAAGTLTLSTNSMIFLNTSESRTFTATRNTGGAISAVSSNTSVATVSVSGTTVTVTTKGYGSANITVSVGDVTNYTTPANATCAITVTQKSSVTPSQINEIAASGQAPNVFAIGDLFPIKFNGKVSDGLTLSNQTYYAAIIGINHNASREGNNRVHFKFPYDSSGKQLAFCDNKYGNNIGYGQSTTSGQYFNMNNASSTTNCQYGHNAGGWAKCQFYTNIIPLFKAAMESGWRNVLKTTSKWSDNNTLSAGTAPPDTASNVTATQDDLWLLDEFEYHGARTYANSASQNYQKQYQYYINGNSKVHYRHDQPASDAWVWARGVGVGGNGYFCSVHTSGYASSYLACSSGGVALGFAV